MSDSETIHDNYQRQCHIRKKIGPTNKATIFAALAAADIELVLVTFDGEGDSGQIEDVVASRRERPVSLPDVKIRLLQAVWGKSKPEASKATLRDAIESLCFAFLEEDNGGWENDGGAFGEFRLTVAARTVELEFNARFTDISTSNHSY
jgi:hypothetical protein